MNKWKELEIDNLPSDIKLSENIDDCEYRIECSIDNIWMETSHYEWWMILREIGINNTKYRYRKPEPKATMFNELGEILKKYNYNMILNKDGSFDVETANTPQEAKK